MKKQPMNSQISTGMRSKKTETTPSTPKHLTAKLECVNSSNTVRILGKTYKIETLPDSVADGEFGSCNYALQSIAYNTRLNIDEMKDTILHEMVHCLDHGMQTELTERQVHALSTGFYSLLKDNPDFFIWILGESDV